MIHRLFRFHGYNALNSVYRQGVTLRGSLLNMKYAPRKPGQSYRAAVVVSKKVHKSAVVRNRIRRRVFEQVRLQQDRLGSVDIVITIFSDQVATVPAAQLHEQVDNLLSKIPGVTPDGSSGGHGIVNTKRNS